MKYKVRVKYKGGISKIINKAEEAFELDAEVSLAALIAMVFRAEPNLSDSNSPVSSRAVLVAVNDNFIPAVEYESTMLKTGDDVTLFPIVSGG